MSYLTVRGPSARNSDAARRPASSSGGRELTQLSTARDQDVGWLKNAQRAKRRSHGLGNVARRQVTVMLLDHAGVAMPELRRGGCRTGNLRMHRYCLAGNVGGMISAALRLAQSKVGTFSIARRCAASSRALASA